MPLLKLWNSLFGRSKAVRARSNEESTAAIPIGTADLPGSQSSGSQSSKLKLSGSKPVGSKLTGSNLTGSKPAKRKSAAKRGFFGGGPHAGLCRQLKSLEVSSVLEISVDDGSRAIAVMETVCKNCADSVRYLAIDPFENADGTTTLKKFYQTLRAHQIRPQLYPGTVDRELGRIARTIGTVDLVVIAAETATWQNHVTLRWLSRISNEGTAVFYQDGDKWTRYQLAPTEYRRAA